MEEIADLEAQLASWEARYAEVLEALPDNPELECCERWCRQAIEELRSRLARLPSG